MADEKLFTIPLRKEFLKAPIYKRTSKAVRAVKQFISRHMKAEEVKIGPELNLALWSKGMRNPPSRVKVKSILRDKVALVTLPEAKFVETEKVEEKKSLAEKILSKKEAKAEDILKEEDAKQKELRKELKKEEELTEKKEHAQDQVGKPSPAFKAKEKSAKMSKVVPQSGKKESHEAKP